MTLRTAHYWQRARCHTDLRWTNARNPQLFAKSDPEKAREARCCTLGQLAEQFAIVEKKPANDFRDAEHVLAMRDGEKNVVM